MKTLKMMKIEKVIEILEECWRYSKSDKYTDIEIRAALDIAIYVLKVLYCLDGLYKWED